MGTNRPKGDMEPMVAPPTPKDHYQKQGSVDELLSALWGCKPGTAHQRRFGHEAINRLCADVIRVMRERGEVDALATWFRPIEEATECMLRAGEMSHRLRAALSDADEDSAEARFMEDPCERTAHDLLHRRATDRLASLEHDREIAKLFGIEM